LHTYDADPGTKRLENFKREHAKEGEIWEQAIDLDYFEVRAIFKR
jgi:hypothetical protein